MPTSTANELPPLSNHDIEVLYDIVARAETLPGPPFRALFAAYDTILEQEGINPDHDQLYFRFLFHMQENRLDNESLLERFRSVLAQMGIELEVDPEGEGIEEITRNIDYPRATNDPPPPPPKTTPSRRASFNTFQDITAERGRDANTVETTQQQTHLRPPNGAPIAPSSDLGSRRRARSQSRSTLLSQLPLRGRVNGRSTSDHITAQHRPRRASSVSSRGSFRIIRNGQDEPYAETDYTADSFEDQAHGREGDNPGSNRDDYEPDHYVPSQMLYRPSDTQMLRDMETFEYHRARIAARKLLKTWRRKAAESREQFNQMYDTAYRVDRRTLLNQSMDAWKAALQEKRRMAETDRFFEALESRAEKARDLFLLTKAFTHWAQSASDEVQRTSVARRHILRTRYFNAWRDITAVNELKVRRHGLKKFWNVWRRQTAVVQEDNYRAVTFYHENLVYRVYWKWFWAFCERRAPVWSIGRLKRTVFTKWVEIARDLRQREAGVQTMRDHDVERKALQHLRDKFNIIQKFEGIAQEFRRIAALSLGFAALRKQAQLKPRFGQVFEKRDSRILTSAFQTWRLRAQQARQAAEVDRLRIMRNAFTAWNDGLRMQVLAFRINDRILVQTLYKWAIASRVSLFRRVQDAQKKQAIFSLWRKKSTVQQSSLDVAEREFAALRRRRTLRTCLRKLEAATIERKAKEHQALSIYQPKLLQSVFTMLEERQRHFSELERWSKDARYFVLTSTCLKRWKEATKQAKRNRKREAYAQVRRAHKLNLVKNVLGTWKAKTDQLRSQEQQAIDIAETRTTGLNSRILANWHAVTMDIRKLGSQAIQYRNSHLCAQTFAKLKERHFMLQSLDHQAAVLRQESTDVVAANCLKKFEWRLFQTQRQEQNALALQHRNFEKHVRAMVRFWAEQTSERRAQRVGPGPPSPSPIHARRDEGDEDEDEEEAHPAGDDENDTKKLEAWTAFDAASLGLSKTQLDLSLYSPHDPKQRPTGSAQPGPLRGGRSSQPAPTPGRISQTAAPTRNAPSPSPPDDDFPPLEDFSALGPFVASTPLPGYLRTPSKRSIARLKRQFDLGLGDSAAVRPAPVGIATAPVPGFRNPGADAERGVTSFERRLRAEGYGAGAGAGGVGGAGAGRGRGRGAGRGRVVGFEDIEEEG